jgi:hypothetical protein
MIDSLGKLMIDPLAERWKGAAIGGSLVFWLLFVGLALFTWTRPARTGDLLTGCRSVRATSRSLWCLLPPAGEDGAAIVGAIAVVIATAFLVQALAPSLLALALGEGWGRWKILAWGPVKIQKHFRKIHTISYPLKISDLRPTRIGNAFAALAERVEEKFGYKLAVLWGILIASLPQEAKDDLAARSRAIFLACQNVLLSSAATILAIFVIPGGWAKLVIPGVALVVTIFLWRSMAVAADEYCDLILTTLFMHRYCLYNAAGEAAPLPGEDIRKRGAELTNKILDIIR